jgi:4-oxalomesaconate hydratase
MSAQAMGRPGGTVIGEPDVYGMTIGAPQVYAFEPHQSELCGFKPDTLLDISSVWEKKWRAIQCMESQPLMWAYYENVARQRGAVARGQPAYAEAYQRIFPSTVTELS